MQFSTAPSLLVGLGTRIFVDRFLRSQPPNTSDSVLLGLWQGVGIYYAFVSSPSWGIGIAFAVGAKLLFEYYAVQDTTSFVIVFLGVSLGILSTDILSRYLDDLFQPKRSPDVSGSSRTLRNRPRSVQFQQSRDGEGSERRPRRRVGRPRSDIVSVLSLDTNSDLIDPKPTMSLLDREVAALRTQASLADSERRRFKEEKKWAKSLGNAARAAQMSWQVKRYTALMQSFHREADAKIIEASSSQRPRQGVVRDSGHASSSREPYSSSRRRENVEHPRANGSAIPVPHRRERTGTLKSAIRSEVPW